METLVLKRPALPRELLNRSGLLAKDINEVTCLPEGEFRQACTRKVNDFAHRLCHSFKPSYSDSLLCRSGETTGQPFRGPACGECQLGQFSSGLVFIGQIAAARPQPAL